jgi:hypothetical protein
MINPSINVKVSVKSSKLKVQGDVYDLDLLSVLGVPCCE